MKGLVALLAGLLAGSPLAAQTLRACTGFEANARNLIFPVQDGTASFANGAVRFIGLDTGGEPTCCSSHLMVILPAVDDPGEACVLISRAGRSGWSGINVGASRATYDAATGLRVSVPVGIYNGSGSSPSTIEVTVNQATGIVTAR